MKLKSFLFLIAALAMGLVFASCGGDTEQLPGSIIKQGYASDADAIEAAFAFADNVYLSKETNLLDAQLLIPAGKTLHVSGQTINVNAATVIIGEGTLDWGSSANSKIKAVSGTAPVLIAISYDATHYYNGETAGTGSILFVGKDTLTSGGSGKGYFASSDADKVFATGGTALAYDGGGTTSYLLSSYIKDKISITAGTLIVTKDLTGLEILDTATPLTVYGKLGGGTVAAASTVEIIKSGGTVTANTVDISNGKIVNELNVKTTGNFTGKVEFGTLFVTDRATFSDDVKFAAGSVTNAVFTSGKTVSGQAQIGNIAFANNSGNTLVIAADGAIIFTNGINGSFLGNVGTLATLANPVTFNLGATELAVSGAGSIVVSGEIDVENSNTIKVDGTTGVYFAAGGTIVAETYELGGQVGTLSTNGGFILTATGIKNAATGGSASLSYALADAANAVFLKVKQGSTAALENVNISVATGSISLAPDAKLFLNTGGSITSAGGSLAHSGYILSAEAAKGGSILSGSLGNDEAGSVAAGSIGTIGHNFIISSAKFANSGAVYTNAIAGVKAGSMKATAGSVTVFAAE
jgi:hypothetical protein